jgi:hypothetical protein
LGGSLDIEHVDGTRMGILEERPAYVARLLRSLALHNNVAAGFGTTAKKGDGDAGVVR